MGSSESTVTADHGRPRGAPRPVSRKEEALWLLERLVPDGSVNNVPGAAVRVAGRLDGRLLGDAVRAMVRRHETLRTVFRVEAGQLVKELLPAADTAPSVERRSVGDEDELRSAMAEFVLRPFALDGGPLLRVGHFGAPDGDVVCLSVHHLVFDSMSSSIFLEELAAAYGIAADGHDLSAAPVEVVPAWVEPEPAEASLKFWQRHLEGIDPYSAQLRVGDRPVDGDSLAGATRSHVLSAESAAVLHDCQRQLRAPDAVVLLAAYYLLLARHGAGPDFAVGLPVNIRGPRTERTIGYHVNILPLRNHVDDELGFREFVRATRDIFLEAVGHADAPVDVLVPDAPRLDSSWRSSLFRHIFNYLPGRDNREILVGGLPGELTVVETGSSKFDLEFVISPVPGSYEVKAVYSTVAHTARDVDLLLHRYDALLTELGRDPGKRLADITAWCATDQTTVDGAHAPRPQETPRAQGTPRTLPAIVAARATATPDAVAVEEGGRTVTYAALWRAARATAALLREHGVAPGDTVGVSAAAGSAGLTAVLGLWLAGAACGATEAGDGDTALLLPDGVRLALPDVTDGDGASAGEDGGLDPGAAAWRRADGVVQHADLGALLEDAARALAARQDSPADGPVDAVWHGAPGDPAAVLEMWLPLATGGRVIVATGDDGTLDELLDRHPHAALRAAPATWWDLLARGGPVTRPALLTEPPPTGLTPRLTALGARPYLLRVDDCGVWGVATPVDADGRRLNEVRPAPGVRVRVTGRPGGRELPLGVTGDLRVSRGGHDAVATGLLGRWTADGTVEVLGSVARRLYRLGGWVEPERAESVLSEHPAVAQAAVVELPGDEPTLVALVRPVPGPDEPPSPETVREHAELRLPRAAVPAFVLVTDALPQTADGTVDLVAVTALAAEAAATRTPPADGDWTPRLVDLWNTLTGRQDLGPDANFFGSGGHSLLAAQLVQQLEEDTGIRLRLADVFENPTPAGLAVRMSTLAARS
ncbi:Non-ribosomal peptide synthetase component F [Streptomyces sp. yr375]|uniref:condensation domain-containing protein n=1 Tax=Streptomyces sp. yr375 TaxID=1761906 RepID=UPI0008BDB2A6|nr:condensation domain-containing protein [Streptomyces sp. yr375]SES46690.1 Non-ribosomal peptide synthetase component F [Streptomyces sp. yr375]